MITTFRPKLNALEARLNLSADPLPDLLVIADQRDFGPEHEIEFDLVAGHAFPPAASDHKGEIELISFSLGATGRAFDDVVVDGRIITAENPDSARSGSDLAMWQANYGVGASAADRDIVIKGQTIMQNIHSNETITIHGSRTE